MTTKALWQAINHQWENIDNETQWLNYYIAIGDIGFVENCVEEIEKALAVIKNATAMLKNKESK